MSCSRRSPPAIARASLIQCGALWPVPACSTPSCGVTSLMEEPCARCRTARAQTCSCGRSRISLFNISFTRQGPRNEQPARLRLVLYRDLLPHSVRHRVVGGAPREGGQLRLLPGEPRRRVVRGRREPVRLQHRQRAPRGIGGDRRWPRPPPPPPRVARPPPSPLFPLACCAALPVRRG